MKNPLGNKLYYSISEVAEITDLQPYTLRAWEKEFSCLRPRRSRGKNRAYRERDIGVILLIKRLLYQERYTTQGVKQKLKKDPELLRQATTVAAPLMKEPPPEESGHVDAAFDEKEDIENRDSRALSRAQRAGFRELIEEVKKELNEILRFL